MPAASGNVPSDAEVAAAREAVSALYAAGCNAAGDTRQLAQLTVLRVRGMLGDVVAELGARALTMPERVE